VPFERQVVVPVLYKGQEVGEGRIDVLGGSLVVLELKAWPALDRVHTAQRLSCLRGPFISSLARIVASFGGLAAPPMSHELLASGD
jgi:GxxExxY protein